MKIYFVFLFLTMIACFANAKPIPDYEEDGQELLKAKDSRYGAIPFFWYQRPLINDDGNTYGNSNGGGYVRPAHHHHKNSLPLYENAGAGWGR